jgi:hypothetical protein
MNNRGREEHSWGQIDLGEAAMHWMGLYDNADCGRKGCWKYECKSLEQRKNDPIFRG